MRLPVGFLLAAWIVLGCILAAVELLAWTQSGTLKGWLGDLQAWYGVGFSPAWWQRSDTHMHILVSATVCAWWGMLCRMVMPRGLPWLPIALTVAVALSDEILQLGSSERSFEWGDQAADACGLVLALPALWLLMRARVEGSARRQGR